MPPLTHSIKAIHTQLVYWAMDTIAFALFVDDERSPIMEVPIVTSTLFSVLTR